MDKLDRTRGYLCGAISYDDNATMWRDPLTTWLKCMGVIVFDPCNKPTDIAEEDPVKQKKRISDGHFIEAKRDLEIIRDVDIRLVTISDFLIVDIDITKYTVGTWEEVTLANSQRKPIIARIEQGKENTPPWLLAMIPHQMIFSTWFEVKEYLYSVDKGDDTNYEGRWIFFKL